MMKFYEIVAKFRVLSKPNTGIVYRQIFDIGWFELQVHVYCKLIQNKHLAF
jgi:hypothetical protein